MEDPRDVALALTTGVPSVMIGSWFAGVLESLGGVQEGVDGRVFEESFGMVSHRAVESWNVQVETFEKARCEMFEKGTSTAKVYLELDREDVEDQIDHVISDVYSPFTYAGSVTTEQFAEWAVMGIQSAASFAEGMPRATR